MAELEMSVSGSLYARYNGGMLGFFLSGAPALYAETRYPILRTRMNQFLEELGALPSLPPQPLQHEAAGRLLKEVIFMVRMQSEPVADFAYLTSLAFQHVILREADPAAATDCKSLALEWMEKYGVPADGLESFASAVDPNQDGSISADRLHSAGLGFLRSLLEPLDTDRDTAFVAMPFSSPYDEYFPNFYKPLLEKLNLRAIRAWGGLSHEAYQEIIGTLIRKADVVLADLSTLNLNVVHEVGLAEGMGKTVFLIAARDEPRPPSNLGDLAIVQYDRSRRGWESRAVVDCAALLQLGKLGAEIAVRD